MPVHFSTDDLPPRDRESFWFDAIANNVLKVTPAERSDPGTFRARFDVHIAGRFTLVDYQTSHRIGRRTLADVSRADASRFHLRRFPAVQIYTVAPTRKTSMEIQLGPNDFCVASTEWPYQSLTKEGTVGSGLVIPHEVFSPLIAGGHLTGPVVVPAASPLGSLLGAAFDAANTQVPAL
jgi:hypothetical protein